MQDEFNDQSSIFNDGWPVLEKPAGLVFAGGRGPTARRGIETPVYHKKIISISSTFLKSRSIVAIFNCKFLAVVY